jgi:cephalosporin-C deacetylase-like acetyl esterase
MKFIPVLLAFCVSAAALHATDTAPDYSAMRAEVEALANLTEAPDFNVVERPDATPTLKPIIYTGADYKGKATRVFAWLGVPKSTKGKVPGVVLVHGGGGTASKDWVANWNNKGYAAISMSLEGHDDKKAKLPEGGPERPGVYGDFNAPLKDQWMYQVIANTTLAASLLRSLPEVDPEKIGINGCSWGGIITATAIGIDSRYAFAIPVYGCGGLYRIPNHYSKALAKNEVYKQVWDPHLRLERARMPILWHS